MGRVHKITPFLWFDDRAEEAVKFYMSVFKDSKETGRSEGPDGSVMSVSFDLETSASSSRPTRADTLGRLLFLPSDPVQTHAGVLKPGQRGAT